MRSPQFSPDAPRRMVLRGRLSRVTSNADDRLLGGIRVIRRVSGPPESPWPGTLAVLPSGESCVLVDADAVGHDWAGWGAVPDGHVLAPQDLIRRTGGHDVIMPVCTERLDDILNRRRSAGVALTDGERVTVAVSILRGLLELFALAGDGVRGEWWTTEGARPVFAASDQGEVAAEASAQVLVALAHDSRALAAELGDAAMLAREPARLVREIEHLEERLFAAAAPEPLAATVFAPRHARAVSVHRDVLDIADSDGGAPRGMWSMLARHVDTDFADLVSRATTEVWRRGRRPRGQRRAGPWIAATVVVAAIVGGAAFVPAAAGDDPSGSVAATWDEPPHPADDARLDSENDERGHSDPPGEAGEPEPIDRIAAALLDARLACDGDLTCLSTLMEDAEASVLPGVVDLPAAERSITLLDEFGGAAVLRVAPVGGEGRNQLVVIVRRDGQWLLRDVHDVAEQP